jgi:hypothetical protein
MGRIVPVLIGALALVIVVAPGATAGQSSGIPAGLERVAFIDYGVGFAAKPGSATALATDYKLLSGHPTWGVSTVHYSVNTTGCSNDCSGAVTAIDNAFNAWEVSGVTYTRASTGDADACGGTDSVTWAPIDGSGGVLAETFVCRTLGTNEIVGIQTLFDSGDTWSDSGAPGKFDIQATATHEEGHSTGLDHVHAPRDARLTMYPYISEGDIGFRTLGCGDRLGVNAAYGTNLTCNSVPQD